MTPMVCLEMVLYFRVILKQFCTSIGKHIFYYTLHYFSAFVFSPSFSRDNLIRYREDLFSSKYRSYDWHELLRPIYHLCRHPSIGFLSPFWCFFLQFWLLTFSDNIFLLTESLPFSMHLFSACYMHTSCRTYLSHSVLYLVLYSHVQFWNQLQTKLFCYRQYRLQCSYNIFLCWVLLSFLMFSMVFYLT